MENDVYWLKPGSWNMFQIDRVFTKQLGEPYNDCLKDTSLFKKNKTIIDLIKILNRIYSQSDCFYFCSQLFALEESNCGCNSSLKSFENDCTQYEYDIETNTTQCIYKYLKEFRKNFQLNLIS